MGDEMAKVIVERPRVPAFNSRKRRRQALDDLPLRDGFGRAGSLRGERKQLNENVAPLCRYLERQVGRPWDKVYSEIAVRLRADSAVQQHVRDHLRDFVAVKPRRLNHGWRSSGGRTLWRQPLYVDPRTGLLCRDGELPEEKGRRRAAAQRRPALPPECIALAEDCELRRIRGIWYEIQLAPLPEACYRPYREIQKRPLKSYDPRSPLVELEVTVRRLITSAVRDAVTNTIGEAGPATDDPVSWQAYRRQHPHRRYALANRLLSRRELRRHAIRTSGHQ